MTSLQSLQTNMTEEKPTRTEIIDRAQFLLNNRKLFSHEEYVKEAKKLISEGEKYGIDVELRILLDPRLEKSASNGTVKISTGKNHYSFLPLDAKQNLKEACAFIRNYRSNFPYRLLKKMALRVLSLSVHCGNVLSEEDRKFLEKFSGLGISTKEEVIDGLKKRAEVLKNRGYYSLAKKITNLMNEVEEGDIEQLYASGLADKIMELFHTVDSKTKLARYYGRGITPPEDFLFSFTEKDRETFDKSLIRNVKTGKAYPVDSLRNLDIKLVHMVFKDPDWVFLGSEVDPGLLNDWLKRASRKDAARFDDIMFFSGIEPIIEKD